jgi:hypothetical protein
LPLIISIFIFRSTFITISHSVQPSTIESSLNELIINDLVFNSNGTLIISWEYLLSRVPKYYHIQIYDENHRDLIFQRFIDGRERSVEIDISKFPSINIICFNIRQKKYCRKVSLPSNFIKSASLVLPSNKQENEQFIYLIGGILLGAILVCSILIIICYCRLRSYSNENLSSITSDEKSVKTFFYHPLNIISYPQQPSNHTSECSLHSSTDTSHLTNDPYHLYQQIPSIQNCQIHSTRTHVLV